MALFARGSEMPSKLSKPVNPQRGDCPSSKGETGKVRKRENEREARGIGGALTATGEALNPAEVVNATAGAPYTSTVVFLDREAPTAAEVKGKAVPVHDGGAFTAAEEAVNPAEVVDAATDA